MSTVTIILRADGNPKMGLGHLYRCLALAEMLSGQFSCILVTQELPASLQEEFSAVFTRIEEINRPKDVPAAEEVIDLAGQLPPAESPRIVVLDGYHFDTEYQLRIRNAGYRLVCIDDIHSVHYVADVVINHAGGIATSDYSIEPYTRLLLGPQYALIRQAFLGRKITQRTEPKGFVCLGGADPPNATLKVLKTCLETNPLVPYSVVVGGAYLHRSALDEYVDQQQGRIDVLSSLSATEMAEIMAESTFGVTSPSTVSFEYLNCGGLLYLEMIADNQRSIQKYYLDSEVALPFADFPCLDGARKNRIYTNQRKLFDGKSPERIKQLFNQLAFGEHYITN